MPAYKEKETEKPIKISTNIKRKPNERISNKILGSMLIILAFCSLILPEVQEDGTAFIMMLILGTAALFST